MYILRDSEHPLNTDCLSVKFALLRFSLVYFHVALECFKLILFCQCFWFLRIFEMLQTVWFMNFL